MSPKTRSLSRSALGCAYGVAVLALASVLPGAKLAVICLSSLGVVFVRMSESWKWALGCYAATSVLALLLLMQKMPAAAYALLLGYYPVIKLYAEKKTGAALRWGIKLGLFNAALAAAFLLFRSLFFDGLPEETWRVPALFLAGNIAFIAYDWALTQLILIYLRKIARRLH